MRFLRHYLVGLALLVALLCLATFLLTHHSSLATPNLDWYVAAERLDPIFAIEGTDPGKLRSALQSFFDRRNEFASMREETAEIRKSLYPETFLRLLPDLETSRQELLHNPTPGNAEGYHQLLLKTIGAYEDGAQKLANAFRGAAESQQQVVFLGGFATTEFMASQMDAVVVAAETQVDKENTRFNCLQQEGPVSCSSIDTLTSGRAAQLGDVTALPPPSADVMKMETMVGHIMKIIDPTLGEMSPLVALRSSCYSYPVVYVRSWQTNTGPDGEVLRSYVGNDAFFYDVRRLVALAHNPYYEKALAAGAELEFQNITNYYMCPDSGIFASDLFRILGVRELAASATTTEAQHLLSLNMLQRNDAAQYVRSDGSDAAIGRYLEGSANLDKRIGELSSEDTYIISTIRAGGMMQFPYLYIARSYASTLFMLGNPTFMPQPISLFSQVGGAPPNYPLRSWHDDLSEVMSENDILIDAKKSWDVFAGLSSVR